MYSRNLYEQERVPLEQRRDAFAAAHSEWVRLAQGIDRASAVDLWTPSRVAWPVVVDAARTVLGAAGDWLRAVVGTSAARAAGRRAGRALPIAAVLIGGALGAGGGGVAGAALSVESQVVGPA
jgi:hypothetical protein